MRYGLPFSAEICGLEHELGEHKPGRIQPGRIKRAALSLQNQNYHILCFLIPPRLYASERGTGSGFLRKSAGANGRKQLSANT